MFSTNLAHDWFGSLINLWIYKYFRATCWANINASGCTLNFELNFWDCCKYTNVTHEHIGFLLHFVNSSFMKTDKKECHWFLQPRNSLAELIKCNSYPILIVVCDSQIPFNPKPIFIWIQITFRQQRLNRKEKENIMANCSFLNMSCGIIKYRVYLNRANSEYKIIRINSGLVECIVCRICC